MATSRELLVNAVRAAAVLAPALLTAACAAAGVAGWALAGVAAGAGLAALLVAWGWLGDRAFRETERRALGAVGRSAGMNEPVPSDPAGRERWALSCAERVSALRSEAAVREAIFSAADAPVLATSGAGTVVFCNRAACEFLERPAAQVIGRELGDFFTQSELLAVHSAARAGGLQRGQVRFAREGVVRTYQALAAAAEVRNGGAGGSVVVLTLRDITELARAAQLKTDFVANASHELRTPLASIRGAVETLQELGDEDAGMRARLVRMIASNAERLEDLTRDLLDLSRLESPEAPVEIGPVDLVELARAVAGLLEGSASRKRVSIEAEIEPGAARLESDPRLLRAILRNLVENAVKFAHEGTAVRIAAEAVDAGAGAGGAPADGPGDRAAGDAGRGPLGTLRLRVIDRGTGIPLAQQQRIFERFFQGDPARTGDAQGRGTGLGLAIVKHAVRTLGGTIGVESVWQEGTTMTVELPGCVVREA